MAIDTTYNNQSNQYRQWHRYYLVTLVTLVTLDTISILFRYPDFFLFLRYQHQFLYKN